MSNVKELLDEKPDGLTRLLHPVAKAEFINPKPFNAWECYLLAPLSPQSLLSHDNMG